MITFKGMKEIEKKLKDLEAVPTKHVTKIVKPAAKLVVEAARARAPIGESGNLRKGITAKPEKSKIKSKKVYDVWMDPKMNDIFVKVTADGTRYYYPASIEYGFLKRDGTKRPAQPFMKPALTENAVQIVDVISENTMQEIDKIAR